MGQLTTLVCDLCQETGAYEKAKSGGAMKKPKGWSIVRYETKTNDGRQKVDRIDLCPKHSKEFEDKYIKGAKE